MGEQFKIIKLNATDSTNQFLKDLAQSETLDDFTVVWTNNQQKGRGQMGSNWQSATGKNLTFSFLKFFDALRVEHQFNLNICVSLAILATLEGLGIPNLRVKWPNDIMSGSFKICGILIENVLKGRYVGHAIIGVGLNVNQAAFENLEKAASLKMITKKTFDLDLVLASLMTQFQLHFQDIEAKTVTQMLPSYEQCLFRKDKISTFKDAEGGLFMGFIRGIDANGKLTLELEDGIVKAFDLKEVSLLY